jgi:multimeric flavodoxin WrbA/putative sterol carrier protein
MKTLTKGQQIFLYVAPFPALAFYKVWGLTGPRPGSFLIVTVAVFAYCLGAIGIAYRWDKPGYFDWAFCVYFGVASVIVALWPERASGFLAQYTATGIYMSLFSAAFFPPLLGFAPFTYHYAKKSTPEEHWGNPIFVRVNRIMTYVWAGMFAVCIGLSLYPSLITRALLPIGLIVGFGVPFTKRFPDFYLKRIGLPSLAEQRAMARAAAAERAQSPAGDLPTTAWQAASRMPPDVSPERVGDQDKPTLRKEKIMKVLALNSSPRSDRESKTALMLGHLVAGMRDAGADVEVVNLREKTVKHCIGCYSCWTKTPGVCVHNDDMTNELFPKWLASDLVVYGSPLYIHTVNGIMKTFIERILPVALPFLERRDGKTEHPLRHRFPAAVVLSVAGFPEEAAFDQLSSYVNYFFGEELLAEIYRPAAETLMHRPAREVRESILNATREAGRELVESRKVSPETLARIKQPLGDPDAMARMANIVWKTCIAESVTPRELKDKGLTPRPDSIQSFMDIMRFGFNPEKAGDTQGTLQFVFSGDVEGSCYLAIDHGTIQAVDGKAEKPDLTIETPFEVWMDIVTRKADGQKMFMEQKYRAVGDLSLLMKMGQLFGG